MSTRSTWLRINRKLEIGRLLPLKQKTIIDKLLVDMLDLGLIKTVFLSPLLQFFGRQNATMHLTDKVELQEH